MTYQDYELIRAQVAARREELINEIKNTNTDLYIKYLTDYKEKK